MLRLSPLALAVLAACGSSTAGSTCVDHAGTYLAHYKTSATSCPVIADFQTVPTQSVLPLGCTDHSTEAGDLCSMTVAGVCTGPASGTISWSPDGATGTGSVLLPSCATPYGVTLTRQ